MMLRGLDHLPSNKVEIYQSVRRRFRENDDSSRHNGLLRQSPLGTGANDVTMRLHDKLQNSARVS
jgi:hypothetical protein